MTKHYIQRPVGRAELESLAKLARAEEDRFFSRNPHLVEPYRNRLVAIALCQGAALQYLGRGYGVNDFDLHFFYRQNPEKRRLSRTVKRIWTTIGSFDEVRVDFIRTVIPSRVCCDEQDDSIELLRAFLWQSLTKRAQDLAQKAVIGLAPPELFEVVIWPQRAV